MFRFSISHPHPVTPLFSLFSIFHNLVLTFRNCLNTKYNDDDDYGDDDGDNLCNSSRRRRRRQPESTESREPISTNMFPLINIYIASRCRRRRCCRPFLPTWLWCVVTLPRACVLMRKKWPQRNVCF